jgi:hydrogenase/urease accessory protein HupE
MRGIRSFTIAVLALAGLLLCGDRGASAHALDPAYLEVRAIGANAYSASFKVPQIAGRPMPLRASLPETCEPRQSGELSRSGTAFATTWVAQCPGGLEGGRLSVEGLAWTGTDVLIRLESLDGANRTARLTAETPDYVFTGPPTFWDVVRTYFMLGVEHILLGVDHLLFVLALMLLVRGTLQLVKTVTAFTVAHSITLTAATLGYVQVPSQPVEAVIALSIVFVATELARRNPDTPSFSERYPWLIAFTFGLLHGFGFAGALAEVGLPETDIPAALLTFNLGVEAGQLLFIAVILVGRSILGRLSGATGWSSNVRFGARLAMTYSIGVIAAYWTIERIAGLVA